MARDPDAPDPDTFMGAVKTCFSKYATFQGRARRPEFWWFALFTLAGSMVTSFLDMALFGAASEAGLLGAVFSLAVLIPSIAVGVRRLHDTDRVGWWYLLVFIPLIGFIVLLMSISMSMPIPLTNTAPSFVIFVLAAGILEEDGVGVVLHVTPRPRRPRAAARRRPPAARPSRWSA